MALSREKLLAGLREIDLLAPTERLTSLLEKLDEDKEVITDETVEKIEEDWETLYAGLMDAFAQCPIPDVLDM